MSDRTTFLKPQMPCAIRLATILALAVNAQSGAQEKAAKPAQTPSGVTAKSAPVAETKVTVAAPAAPIAVKVEMPQDATARILEVVLQGGTGAAIALFGVWVTTRSNRKTNEANHRHEENRWCHQRQWELKRDLLIRVAQALVLTHEATLKWHEMARWVEYLEQSGGGDEPGAVEKATEEQNRLWHRMEEMKMQLAEATAAASLCVSKQLRESMQGCQRTLVDAFIRLRNSRGEERNQLQSAQSTEIMNLLQQARLELGIDGTGSADTSALVTTA